MNRICQNLLRQSYPRSFSAGANASATPTILSRFYAADAATGAAVDKATLDKLVRTNKVVIFMKGNPQAPRCGFSNAVVQIMRMHGVQYDAHDVLQNEALRQGVKDYTDWPTIPQVFIDGEFVGGCDILLQMHQSGDLIEELKKVGIVSELLKAEQAKEEAKPADEKPK
ncbi:glutaredoxin-related protein 5, mitochondrial [Drosophila eugracilis]|uniref:glutaredoxin-related protein 5, mitochondrial n=1 Tax=Drosophila eugracilis TaxID=29029 RepID=UPI0007E65916|nr:glutaredoxin-related protein 5, mitochondrial [Drosophila eugracilis]